jgi:anti-sigma factor RsiW
MSDPTRDAQADEPYITCEEVLTFLWAYLSGELAPERVAEFERHLAVCPSCVAYIDTYGKTIELTRGAFASESAAPEVEEMPEGLRRAVLEARKKEE